MLHDDVRAGLERRPRRPSSSGEERALAALGAIWGDAYELGVDAHEPPRWWALRRDGEPAVSAATPGELAAAIMTDYDTNPVVPR